VANRLGLNQSNAQTDSRSLRCPGEWKGKAVLHIPIHIAVDKLTVCGVF